MTKELSAEQIRINYYRDILEKYNLDKELRQNILNDLALIDLNDRVVISYAIMRILKNLYSYDEQNMIIKDIAKRKLLKKTQDKLYSGYLTEKNRELIYGALMEFLEKIGLLNYFIHTLE